jgi:hypothetical protein
MAGSLGQLDLIGTMATQPIRRMRGTPLNLRVFLTGTCQARFQSRTAATWTPGKKHLHDTLHLRWHQRSASCSHRLMNGDPQTGTAPSGSSDVNVIYGGSKSTASHQLDGESPPVCSNDQPGFAPPGPWLSIYLLLRGKHFVAPLFFYLSLLLPCLLPSKQAFTSHIQVSG